jgi:hypothetical protein
VLCLLCFVVSSASSLLFALLLVHPGLTNPFFFQYPVSFFLLFLRAPVIPQCTENPFLLLLFLGLGLHVLGSDLGIIDKGSDDDLKDGCRDGFEDGWLLGFELGIDKGSSSHQVSSCLLYVPPFYLHLTHSTSFPLTYPPDCYFSPQLFSNL